jgi:hypothetical protein
LEVASCLRTVAAELPTLSIARAAGAVHTSRIRGNIIGGTALFAVIAYGQVMKDSESANGPKSMKGVPLSSYTSGATIAVTGGRPLL